MKLDTSPTTTSMPSSHPNSPKSQEGTGDGPRTELKSIEAAMTSPSTSQEYESSCPSEMVAEILIGTYAADLSSPSIDRVQELSAPDGGITRTFDVSSDDESTVSPLADEQTEMLPREKLPHHTLADESTKGPTADNATIDDEEKVKVSAGWTLQLAEAVSQIEEELDVALTDAAEAGRNQAKAEDDLLKAHLNAESQTKRLRERLETMIQENLILELELESTEEEMKDKEKLHAQETRELQVKMDVELEAIRSERRTLLIRVAALEEENEILCGKLLGDSGEKKKSGIVVALGRKLVQFGYRVKSFRPWTRTESRGTQL